MTKQLTTQNATITTAAVEVKTLTISGKQVTLAVFRQLQEEPLIAEEGTLNGEPWGVVNYHPDKCGDDRFAHVHVVWQRGPELLRARVDKIPNFEVGGRQRYQNGRYLEVEAVEPFRSRDTDRLLAGSVLEWLCGEAEKCPLPQKDVKRWKAQHDDYATFDSGHGFIVLARASAAALEAANARAKADIALAALAKRKGKRPTDPTEAMRWEWQSLEGIQAEADTAVTEARAARDALIAEVTEWGVALADIREAHNHLVEAEAARRERHRAARRSLGELPQLFIAV
ncbi:hypothetical protein J7F02_05860 [Streptomyces sp. ISL-112]|uniref:hypothetical protein n=1 Tax=unclassified Streptomyces TaxID=2593676 RepID=UPI001BE90261|nr:MULTISPECIES: hypothetical protein [unclassified Streptomyces]MBT2425222.1 hypothetical protein [Streptomyces sp. ISL-112]MBT2462013.1 hypothetical protein [Streptomyces sp. ISL-63]